MYSVTFPVLGLVAIAAAESSTVSLFLQPVADPQTLTASIAGSDNTATTYVISCQSSAAMTSAAMASGSDVIDDFPKASAAASGAAPSGIDNLNSDGSNDPDFDNFGEDNGGDNGGGYGDVPVCDYETPFTVIEGPSTVHYSVSNSAVGLISIDCKLAGTTSAVCTGSDSIRPDVATLVDGETNTKVTATLTGDDAASAFYPVVVTAGSTGGGKAATTGSSTSATAKSTGSSTGSSSGSTTQATNAAVAGSNGYGTGLIGALGVAIAGAIL